VLDGYKDIMTREQIIEQVYDQINVQIYYQITSQVQHRTYSFVQPRLLVDQFDRVWLSVIRIVSQVESQSTLASSL
jgi:hypothetical protein